MAATQFKSKEGTNPCPHRRLQAGLHTCALAAAWLVSPALLTCTSPAASLLQLISCATEVGMPQVTISGLQTLSTQQRSDHAISGSHRPVLAGPPWPAQPHVPAQRLQPAATLQPALHAGQAGTARGHCEDWGHQDALPRPPGRASGAAVVVHHQEGTSVHAGLQQGGCSPQPGLAYNGTVNTRLMAPLSLTVQHSPSAYSAIDVRRVPGFC